ncbi:guanosine polyphosphate pyrophosphohydrolase [Helicobacter valdiviensis]|uniref:Guanosine polyphosphate pyrophosphohydrolase n=1 Tax=Helicobacter valdiviensis TaxID=1458358 RepID=A0A2W6PN50_9HELI|nr:Ppx/GppA phosphatase family protein [Helicobacter valdiviensis]PZT48133.1 guanosine polyphosphate pyrophosphohydrolase [Helicobacter valdiviensis]
MAKITAVIDIGSNSARMAIFEKTSHFGFHLLYETKSKVRISESSYQNQGYLQEIPMQRAINALSDFLFIAKIHKARKILCVATSALRDAPNKAYFLALARKIGLNIKIIDGDKEAYYGALAALNLLPYQEGITIDIGGGSTECALIQNNKIIDKISLNLGTIRLKELFFDKSDYKGAREFVLEHLSKLPKHFKHKRIFGIGGTARALSKSIQKQINYPLDTLHAFEYNFDTYQDFFKTLYTSNQKDLLKYNIKEDRLDSIQGGALIFHLALENFGAECVVTSGVGVREGVFLHDLLRHNNGIFPPNFNPSLRSIKDRFINNPHKSKTTKILLSRLIKTLNYEYLEPFYKHILIAAELCDIGIALNFYEKNHHGSYFVFNTLNYALTHKDRLLIATLIKFNNKKIPQNLEFKELLPPFETLNILNFLLSLSDILSYHKNPKTLEISCKDCGFETIITLKNPTHTLEEKLKKLSIPNLFKLDIC